MDNTIPLLWQHEYNSKWIIYNAQSLSALNLSYSAGKKTKTLPSKDPKKQLVVNFVEMYQKNKVSGYEQKIRCCVFDKDFYVWQWKDEFNDWNCYIPGICLELESSYKREKGSLKFYHKDDYEIDFKSMTQINLHTGTKRDVKREKIVLAATPVINDITEAFNLAFKAKLGNDDNDSSSPAKRMRITEKKDEEIAFATAEIPVNPICPKKGLSVCSNGSDIYNVMLIYTNIIQNKNKYYHMQVLKDEVGKNYILYHWGRIGKTGQRNLVCFDQNFSKAKTEFISKFQSKTGNKWENRHSFIKCHEKFNIIQIDYSAKIKGIESAAVKEAECTLDPKLVNLLQIIASVKDLKEKAVRTKYNLNKLPLGNLTHEQINEGIEELNSIQIMLSNDEKASSLIEACNVFYSKIPHDFGKSNPPVISSIRDLKEEMDLMEILNDFHLHGTIEIEGILSIENSFDYLYKTMLCQLRVMDNSEDMYEVIENYMKETHGPTHTEYRMSVITMFEYRREVEYTLFKDFGNKYLLWHGSKLQNFMSILKKGLLISPKGIQSTGDMFGDGIYFADVVSKSANYCHPSQRTNVGLLLLCEVSLGEQQELYAADFTASTLMLQNQKNSVLGKGMLIPHPNGTIERSEVRIPCGKIVNRNSTEKLTLNYNEYIVYDVHQVKIRYVIHTKFDFV